MNANTTLERVRDLAQCKLMELRPFAGEEMSLPETDLHREGFIEGERTLALQILALLEEKSHAGVEPVEEEMVLGLGRT